MDIKIAVKDRIVELCKSRNITVNKLGTICGVTQSTLKNILSGRNVATVLTIKKLCDGLDISIVDFFNTDTFKKLDPETK